MNEALNPIYKRVNSKLSPSLEIVTFLKTPEFCKTKKKNRLKLSNVCQMLCDVFNAFLVGWSIVNICFDGSYNLG